MAEDERRPFRARQRDRERGKRRTRQILVKLSDEEYEKIAARAAVAGMTEASYLALAGQQDPVPSGTESGLSAVQLRALGAELYALKRILRGAGVNLNQLAMVANASGHVSPAALYEADRIVRTFPRLEEFLTALHPLVKW